MDNLNRRELVRSLTVAVSSVLPMADEQQRPSRAAGALAPNALYVVLHGMVGVLYSNSGIQVLVPSVDGHAYGFGTFGKELMLMAKYYRLGPTSGNGALGGNTPLSLDTANKDAQVDLRYYNGVQNTDPSVPQPSNAVHVIYLPLPTIFYNNVAGAPFRLRVTSRRVGGADKPFFTNFNSPNGIGPSAMPVVYAFGYSYNPAVSPFLESSNDGTTWTREPDWIPSATGGIAALHIWSEPAFAAGSSHLSQHAGDAVSRFNSLFNPPLGIGQGASHPAPDPIDNGQIPLLHQYSMPEQRQNYKSGDVIDCWTIFVPGP